MRKFSDEDSEKFEELFGLDIEDFIDIAMYTFGIVCVDIFKFEKLLIEQYGYDPSMEGSMDGMCVALFGNDVTNWIRKIIGV